MHIIYLRNAMKIFTNALLGHSGISSHIFVIGFQFVTIYSCMHTIVYVCDCIKADIDAIRRQEMTYSIPCDDVSLSVTEDLEMVRNAVGIYRKGGTNFCSLRSISDIVEKASERILRQRIAKGTTTKRYISCGNRSAEPHAADFLTFFTELETSDGERAADTLLRWKTTPGKSHVGTNLTYNNGRIAVNRSDFYYVFVSLTFTEGTHVVQNLLTDGTNARLMNFIVAIYKQNRMYKGSAQIRLLDNVTPVCRSNNGGLTTVHIGSHIFLDKYDEVFVKVMDTHRLVPNATGNTFGVFPQQ